MQLDPRASAAGVRLDCARGADLDQCRGAGACRERASAGRSGSPPDDRPAGAAGAAAPGCRSPAICLRALLLTDPAPPEHWPELAFVAALAIHDAVAEVAPALRPQLFDQMAERSSARRQEVRRHPDRRRGLRAGRRCRGGWHRRQLRQPSGRHRLSRHRSRGGGSRRSQPKRCSRRCRPKCSGVWRNGTRASISRPSAPTGSRARPGAAIRSACASPRPGAGRAASTTSTKRAAWCCRCRTAGAGRSPPATSSSCRAWTIRR